MTDGKDLSNTLYIRSLELPCIRHEKSWRNSIHEILNGLRKLYKSDDNKLGKLTPKHFDNLFRLLCTCHPKETEAPKSKENAVQQAWENVTKKEIEEAVDFVYFDKDGFLSSLDQCEQLYGHLDAFLARAKKDNLINIGTTSGVDRFCFILNQAIKHQDVKMVERTCTSKEKPIQERVKLEILKKDIGNFIGFKGGQIKHILKPNHQVDVRVEYDDKTQKVWAILKTTTEEKMKKLKEAIEELDQKTFKKRRDHEDRVRTYEEDKAVEENQTDDNDSSKELEDHDSLTELEAHDSSTELEDQIRTDQNDPILLGGALPQDAHTTIT